MVEPDRKFEQLTDLEARLLREVAQGRSSKEMSRDFGLEPRTIDTYLSKTGKKLGFADRQSAAGAFVKYEAAMSIRCRLTSERVESAPETGQRPSRRTVNDLLVRLHLPPLGGTRNDDDLTSRLFASAKIAGAVFLVAVTLVLIVTVIFWAFALIKL